MEFGSPCSLRADSGRLKAFDKIYMGYYVDFILHFGWESALRVQHRHRAVVRGQITGFGGITTGDAHRLPDPNAI